ncbi:MAG: hypothetical protein ACE5GN_06740 [Waddliaceae bacterium]
MGRAYTAKHKTISNLLVRALNHPGFAVIHAISPCPTFNKNVTFKSVSQITADVPEDHDTTNRMKAMELALAKDKLYLGLFYQSEEPTLEAKLNLHERYDMRPDIKGDLGSLLAKFQ